jgi:uncharacterized membrane protein (DUF485 family)
MEVRMAGRSRGRNKSTGRSRQESQADAYTRLAADPDFVELRRRYRRFAFPATIAFMLWYITYVVCNNWARDFMSTPVVGNINVALVFGLLQFVSTFVIAFLYARHADRTLDPLSGRLREDFERSTEGRSR